MHAVAKIGLLSKTLLAVRAAPAEPDPQHVGDKNDCKAYYGKMMVRIADPSVCGQEPGMVFAQQAQAKEQYNQRDNRDGLQAHAAFLFAKGQLSRFDFRWCIIHGVTS